MRVGWVAAILAVTTLSAPTPAHACVAAAPLSMEYIEHADVLVVGQLSHYELVEDQSARERRRRQIQRAESPEVRAILTAATGYMSDYARFRITVREALRGEAGSALSVTWNNSTFGDPSAMAAGEYLVALSAQPDTPNADGRRLSVLQSPCSPPFLFPADSAEAPEVRRLAGR